MDGTVLVANDDRTIRTVLTQALTRAGCKVHATSSLVTLMRWVDEGKGDLVISDVVMPDGNGLEQLPKIAAARPGLPVIVISAQNTIMTAIQAAEAEAYDYLPKPFDLPDLMKRAARALEIKRRVARPRSASEQNKTSDLPLVGRTAAMQGLYRLVARVMNTNMPVLITGESGTGKSLIARAIHDFSDRRSQPFVVVSGVDLEDMDGPSAALARAKGGSLLFDEVGDLSDTAQGRIVRMLDALGDTAPRIMATSQTDLMDRLDSGTFRQDLFYRLGGVTLHVPSLRERVDDIPLLAEHFLTRVAREGAPLRRMSPPAMDPANTRAEGDKLSASVAKHLRRYFDLHGGELPPPGLYTRILREVEGPLIEIALDATAGNQAKCADLLGINRNTLRKKITELDIRVTRRRKLM